LRRRFEKSRARGRPSGQMIVRSPADGGRVGDGIVSTGAVSSHGNQQIPFQRDAAVRLHRAFGPVLPADEPASPGRFCQCRGCTRSPSCT
jgi:hypothetical protein